jgi:ubiquinone/menaquinone biosynthesis C-methylase UbiE
MTGGMHYPRSESGPAENQRMSDIEESVEIVGAPWKESFYYDEAERWTSMFWDEGTPFRKLFDKLDLRAVLELACGHGRHSARMAGRCERLILMDIFQENIDHCRRRLRFFNNIEGYVNNGYDFRPVADRSLTSIVCYDSMVHFSRDIVFSYLQDAARVLMPGGCALLHHSNYPTAARTHYGTNPYARNEMTVPLFQEFVAAAGLEALETRIIPWGDIPDLDCLSLVSKPGVA